MAEEANFTGQADELPELAGPPRLRDLWQVPVFFLGLLVIAALTLGRLYVQDAQSRKIDRQLAEAHLALEETPPDTQRAMEIGESILARFGQSSERAGEAHFVLGSAYLFLAGDPAASSSADPLQKARKHLEQAESRGVPEVDRPRLYYRLAKTWFYTGADPKQIIHYLGLSVEQAADNPIEGYDMLAQAYLRLPKPNLRAALKANEKQLGLPIMDDNVLAPARLLRGELFLQMGQPAEAERFLSRINNTAPPPVQARARALRARCCQDKQQWALAQKLWQEALADSRQPPLEPGKVLFYLGVCHQKLGQAAEAAGAWEEAMKHGTRESHAAQAAGLMLADWRLTEKSYPAALQLFEGALKDVAKPADYRNLLLGAKKAAEIVEHGCHTLKEAGDFTRAQQLAGLYAHLVPARHAQELRGKLADAWAADLQDRAETNDDRAALEEEARIHLVEAGAAYEAVAGAAQEKAEQVEFLWRSGNRYLQGQDFAKAVAVLDRFIQTETAPERLGEGWYTQALAQRLKGDDKSAGNAFRKCLEYPSYFSFRARYYLAKADIDQGKLDDGEEALKQNLDLMRLNPDTEAYQKSLFALGGLLYQKARYRQASFRLDEFLNQFPANPRTPVVRFQLAECYRRLAVQENLGLPIAKLPKDAWSQSRFWLTMAAVNYKKLKDDLEAREASESLSVEDQNLLHQAGFNEAECRLELLQYADAVRLYQSLAERYQKKPECLPAFRQLWRCYCAQGQQQKALEIAHKARLAFNEFTPAEFNDEVGTRESWEGWLKKAESQ